MGAAAIMRQVCWEETGPLTDNTTLRPGPLPLNFPITIMITHFIFKATLSRTPEKINKK